MTESTRRDTTAAKGRPGRTDRPGHDETILGRLTGPSDLKDLTIAQLEQVAAEIRAELIEKVAINGGHLGASLGPVELIVAMHVVYDSPRDHLVFDVGHQAYAHKLLTGRLDRFHTLRQEGGISGFLSRDESEHDAFGAGHASTSISAALGMAVADHLRHDAGSRPRTVALIGDGALTGGMAFEALNNGGHLGIPMTVILNDNEMSIARNVGALSKYLDKVRTDRRFGRAKDELERLLERMPQGDMMVDLGKRLTDSVKAFMVHGMIWEELGYTYLGPIDGHNLRDVIDALQNAVNVDGPVFLHVVTEKGRGYAPAADDHERSHAVSARPKVAPVGTEKAKAPTPPKYQDVFAAAAIELANEDDRIVAITAAMPTGTSVGLFGEVHPDRTFDVGIAEQHAVTFAAGMATQGMRPIAAIYSTFLKRAYDQIYHDVCLQRLPVVFAMDRAGFAGDDGRTHHGIYDLSYLRCMPNMTVMAPKDEAELRHMLATSLKLDGPSAIRYPRGAGVGVPIDEPMHALPIGRSEVLREGDDVAIVACGAMVLAAERAAELLRADGISATVVNARFIKPLDERLILDLADRCGAIVTVEENVAVGGFGAAVLECLSQNQRTTPVRVIAIPDQVFEQASQDVLRARAGLDPAGIASAARDVMAWRDGVTGQPVNLPITEAGDKVPVAR
ncbi:MAG TPA: 1-deoxy-D-xylulose-5-phosphate synthase [Thermomicrobiales bacterium]|nr:1-deoxy-D-xylulose-5-phosphate synthase [Thermomicrobiales bacterium]